MCDCEPVLKSKHSISRFLSRQVFRTDYLIASDLPSTDVSYPGKYKLERLHELCIMKGYRTPQACEHIQNSLFRTNKENRDSGKEMNCLTLLQLYLPDCVTAIPLNNAATACNSPAQTAALLSQKTTAEKPQWRESTMEDGHYRYLLYLPPDVHALMIEKDGGLLAA